ncbi:MAG: hypothetical protein FWF77_01600 [Defluviitaleaceae bacterium]|nr:hypothetical protein [Defluviitaleaceae bacterium]
MTRLEIKHVEEVLSVMVDQPLRDITRAGAMVVADFGELVEVDTAILDESGRPLRDENGRRISQMSMKGKYTLDALCSMRFSCGDEVIFAKSDMFLPTEEIAGSSDFIWDTFDWHIRGNNFFDVAIAKHFGGEFSDYIVKSVKANKFGDLTITFKSGFILELFADGSGYSENWRFGEINSVKPIIALTGNGIDIEAS